MFRIKKRKVNRHWMNTIKMLERITSSSRTCYSLLVTASKMLWGVRYSSVSLSWQSSCPSSALSSSTYLSRKVVWFLSKWARICKLTQSFYPPWRNLKYQMHLIISDSITLESKKCKMKKHIKKIRLHDIYWVQE